MWERGRPLGSPVRQSPGSLTSQERELLRMLIAFALFGHGGRYFVFREVSMSARLRHVAASRAGKATRGMVASVRGTRSRVTAAFAAVLAIVVLLVTPNTASAAVPHFQLPFHCDQVWSGQTRTDHSPPQAIDFNRANDFGDHVLAAAAGTAYVQDEGAVSYGLWIEIRHGDGYRTRYAHLSAVDVRDGQQVRRGQLIGRVGNSGGSYGAHLHYEELLNGSPIRAEFNGDPALYYGTKPYRSHNC